MRRPVSLRILERLASGGSFLSPLEATPARSRGTLRSSAPGEPPDDAGADNQTGVTEAALIPDLLYGATWLSAGRSSSSSPSMALRGSRLEARGPLRRTSGRTVSCLSAIRHQLFSARRPRVSISTSFSWKLSSVKRDASPIASRRQRGQALLLSTSHPSPRDAARLRGVWLGYGSRQRPACPARRPAESSERVENRMSSAAPDFVSHTGLA